MTPWEQNRIAKKVEDRFRSKPHGPRRKARTIHEYVKPVPLALWFDLVLTTEDRIRLHGLGVCCE